MLEGFLSWCMGEKFEALHQANAIKKCIPPWGKHAAIIKIKWNA
jgi:hypothetical protein